MLSALLFILAGALMETGGISERIVDLAMAIVGRVRGGLAMVAVVAEILFSGISGSTAADVSAISSLLVPSMRKARDPDSTSTIWLSSWKCGLRPSEPAPRHDASSTMPASSAGR